MKVTVWELAIRLFHWILVMSVIGAFVTSLEEDALTLHIWFGQAIVALMLFRLGWGFIGNPYAKFKEFLKGPKAAFEYLLLVAKDQNPRYLGHNPAAGMMFLVMGVVFTFLIASGYILLGGMEEIGPLTNHVSKDLAALLEPWHKWIAYLLALLAVGHVAAALVESRHQSENLPLAMVSGVKEVRSNEPLDSEEKNKLAQAIYLVLLVGLLAGGLWVFPLEDHNLETQNAVLEKQHPGQELYTEECGACHFDFSANLLPRENWEKMMLPIELETHFSDDASLDEEDREIILKFLREGALEKSNSEVSYYLGSELSEDPNQLRFTKTHWWKGKHESITKEIFDRKKIGSKLNCGACHSKAKYGSFADRDISIPD